MANVQVRNVDEAIVSRLKSRAGERGQSLQGYLSDLLAAEAAVVSNDALLESAAVDESTYRARSGEAAAEIRRGRADREHSFT